MTTLSPKTLQIRLQALGVATPMFAYRMSLTECRATKVSLYDAVTAIVAATGLTVAAIVRGLQAGAAYEVEGAAFILAD